MKARIIAVVIDARWSGYRQLQSVGSMLAAAALSATLSLTPCLSSSALAVEAAHDTPANARELQMEGTRLQLQGNVEGAITKYKESLALEPNEKLQNLLKKLDKQGVQATPSAPPATHVATEPQPAPPAPQVPSSTAADPVAAPPATEGQASATPSPAAQEPAAMPTADPVATAVSSVPQAQSPLPASQQASAESTQSSPPVASVQASAPSTSQAPTSNASGQYLEPPAVIEQPQSTVPESAHHPLPSVEPTPASAADTATIISYRSGITGIYFYEDMLMGEKIVGKYEFKPDGTVYINSKMQGEIMLNYKQDNNKIIIGNNIDNIVLTLQQNGNLKGKAGMFEINLIKSEDLPDSKTLQILFESFLVSLNNMNNFIYSKVIKIDNVQIVNYHDFDNIYYYMEFKFDKIQRIDSNSFESNFSEDELKEAFGSVFKTQTYNNLIEGITKSGFKTGDKINKPGNSAVILENIKGKWNIKSTIKPEESAKNSATSVLNG